MGDKAEVELVATGSSKFKSKIKEAEDSLKEFQKTVGGISILTAGAFGVAGLAIGNFVVSSTKAAIDFEQKFNSFTRLVQGDANKFLAELNKASEGTVSNLSLVTQANNAILLGIKQEQLPELLEASRLLGAAVGKTTEEAFSDLTLGIGRQSRVILDNLGIIVKSEDAYKDYADSIGVSVEALTAQQRQIAFNKTVIYTIAESTEKLAGSVTDATTETQKFTKEWEDFKVKAGDPSKEVLSGMLGGINKLLDTINERQADIDLYLKLTGQKGFPGQVFPSNIKEEIAGLQGFMTAAPGETFQTSSLQDETIRKENNRFQIAIDNANTLTEREKEFEEFAKNADLSKIENARELNRMEADLNQLRKDGIEIMGNSFLVMLGRVKDATTDIYHIGMAKGQFVDGKQVTWEEMDAKRTEARRSAENTK